MKKRIPSMCCMWVLSLAFLCGCSIKEDRSECPCRMTIDLSEVDDDRFNFIIVTAESVGGLLFNKYLCTKPFPEQLVFTVPKGMVNVNVISEESNRFPIGLMPYFGDGLPQTRPCPCEGTMFYFVAQGEECPPVYLDSHEVDATLEQNAVKAQLLKNYCRIKVNVNSTLEHTYKLRFTGNYCGYDGQGKPLKGDFYYDAETKSQNPAYVNVSRQSDNALNMRVLDADGSATDFAIGKYIEEAGYDWMAESLEDIELTIDYVRTEIIFKVRDWEKVYTFDITL